MFLDELMGDTILGTKYIKSLRKGIESLEKNRLEVDNGTFKVGETKCSACLSGFQ